MEKPAIAGGTPVRDTKLYYGHQFVDQADVKAVEEVLTSDYLTCGPKVEALEQKLCALTGAAYAVACSNGTAALHIAAMAAGVGAGDELVTTPITFAASANCALYCGARPVLQILIPIRTIFLPRVFVRTCPRKQKRWWRWISQGRLSRWRSCSNSVMRMGLY